MDNKILRAVNSGDLDLNGIKVSCAVLEDGTRILVNRSLSNAVGIKGSGSYWQKKKDGEILPPEYLSAQYLQPYISPNLYANLTIPIQYINANNQLTEGVSADLLADICDVYVKAGEDGALTDNQHISENAYKMLLAFAKVGIIALVDEATGYQHIREKDELQRILKAYISEELLPWQKRFPDIYYKELFRLNGWDYTVSGIKKRPSVIGKWTNVLIYDQLPKGVKDELMKKTPKSDAGNKTIRYHQFLTLDIGEPNLTAQINQIVTLFQLSDNMQHMWSQFNKLKARQQGQLEIDFKFDEKGHTLMINEAPTEQSLFNKSLKQALDFNPNKK